jgi:transglutaminase-like putative cysteine protease
MNFAIRYLTEYRYSAPVTDNLNALRVKPATLATQSVEDFVVRVDPESRLARHLDYFGTQVIEFGISRPHQHLTIDVRARVKTSTPDEPPEAGWDRVEERAYRGAAGEFLLLDGSEPDEIAIDELVGVTRADTPLATLRRLVDVIPDRFEYRAGVTYVGSTVGDLLAAGAGVCQDFAHLALLLLRRHGIAARYVSGYLWAAPEDDGDDSVEVETHAWLEALLPAGGRRGEPVWVGADPTNRRLAGETHVKIGHGRRYADVPPIKGVYRGTAMAELDASVRMTRLDPQASARA